MSKPKRNKAPLPTAMAATNDANKTRKFEWNRKEVAGLLMVGAGIISGLQASIFSTWVQAKLVDHGDQVAHIVAVTGAVSTLMLTLTWLAGRVAMSRPLPQDERPSWAVSLLIVLCFVAIFAGWVAASLQGGATVAPIP